MTQAKGARRMHGERISVLALRIALKSQVYNKKCSFDGIRLNNIHHDFIATDLIPDLRIAARLRETGCLSRAGLRDAQLVSARSGDTMSCDGV